MLKPDAYILFQLFFSAYGGGDAIIVVFTFLSNFYIFPYLSISKLMQSLTGKTLYKLLAEYKELSKQFWGRHIWGRGYFAASSGNVTDEVIMEYIAAQDLQKNDGDFHITP